MKTRTLLAALILFLFAHAASATVITFSGLPGPNFTPMPNPYVESNFTVTPTSGNWFQGLNFGNPIPSIFSNSDVAAIQVTQNTVGQFTFSSVDLADASLGLVLYDIKGFLGGGQVFSTSGGPLLPGFTTIPSPNPSATIDLLRITMTRNGTSSYNIDNINVNIPEPASAIAVLGLPCLCLARRRR